MNGRYRPRSAALGGRALVWMSAAVLAALCGAALAQNSVVGVIEERMGVMQQMSAEMKLMKKLIDRRTFSANVALRHAQKIDALSHGIPRLFPPGTDMLPSEARPDVWQRRAEFESLAGLLETETRKLVFATESGLRPAIRSQYAVVIQRCGACHNGFRRF